MMKTKFWITLIIIVTALCYSNIHRNEFLFDDLPAITENASTETPINFSKVFLTPSWWSERHLDNIRGYRPLTTLSFSINRFVHGLSVEGYHIANSLLHLLNSLIIYFLILILFNRRLLAGATSLVFATHPLHTEAVTGIVTRADELAAFFVLLALLSYIKSWQPRFQKKLLLLSLSSIFLLAGLASKESASCFILIVISYELCFSVFPLKEHPKDHTKTIIAKAAMLTCFLFLTLAYLLWWRPFVTGQYGDLVIAEGVRPPGLLHNWPIAWRLTAFKAFAYYMRLLFWPVRLSGDYLFNQIPLTNQVTDPLVLVGIILFFGFLCFGVWAIVKGHRGIAFGVFFFYAAYAPVSNFVIPIGALVGERLLYLPSLGFCIVVGLLFEYFFAFLKRRMSLQSATALLGSIISLVIIGYGARAFARNFDWKNPYVFFKKTSQTSPNSAVSHYSAAVSYLMMIEDSRYIERWMKPQAIQRLRAQKGKGRSVLVERGLKSISRALQITEQHPVPKYLNVYGALLAMAGRLEQAKNVLTEVVKEDPRLIEAKVTLGVINLKLASRVDRKDPEASRMAQQYLAESVKLLSEVEGDKEFLRKTPMRLAEIYFNLSIAQEKLGDYDRALESIDKAFVYLNKTMKSTGEGHFLLGRFYVIKASILSDKGDYEQAIEALANAKQAGFPELRRFALGMRQLKPLHGHPQFKVLMDEDEIH